MTGKYLDYDGLDYLWSKIKATFVSKDDDVVYMAEDDGEGGAAEGGGSLPANIIAEEDGLYQIKGVDVYPVSHPDISTQPSVLPQRFGKEKIYEVLVPYEDNTISNNTIFTSSKHFYLLNIDIQDDKIYVGTTDGYPPTTTVSENNMGTGYTLYIYYSTSISAFYIRISSSTYQYGGIVEGIDSAVFTDGSNTFMPLLVNDNTFHYLADVEYSDSTGVISRINNIYKLGMPIYGYSDLIEIDRSKWFELFGITNPNANIVPSTATIIEASSFNSKACVPAICKKENGKWTITNNENITPDFTLVRYIGDMKDYYYENNNSSSDPSPTIIKSFDIPSGATTSEWPNQMNVSEIWGDENLHFKTGQIIGKVIVNSNDKYDLVVIQDSSSIAVGAPSVNDVSLLLFGLNRTGDYSPNVVTAPPYDIHIDFYAL